MALNTANRRGAMIAGSAGWNQPEFPPSGSFDALDRHMALGGVERVAADPGKLDWFVQGTFTINMDQVRGY